MNQSPYSPLSHLPIPTCAPTFLIPPYSSSNDKSIFFLVHELYIHTASTYKRGPQGYFLGFLGLWAKTLLWQLKFHSNCRRGFKCAVHGLFVFISKSQWCFKSSHFFVLLTRRDGNSRKEIGMWGANVKSETWTEKSYSHSVYQI